MVYIKTIVLPPTHITHAQVVALRNSIEAAVQRTMDVYYPGMHISETTVETK